MPAETAFTAAGLPAFDGALDDGRIGRPRGRPTGINGLSQSGCHAAAAARSRRPACVQALRPWIVCSASPEPVWQRILRGLEAHWIGDNL